jgi:uncharacterized BrkB/YihY/UPF0761 family membrane protein
MPDHKDSFWQMVGDIVRETSPVVRSCVLLGLCTGVGGAIWLMVKVIAAAATDVVDIGPLVIDPRAPGLWLGLIFFLGVLSGMIVGLVVGVVIELILEHLFGIKFDIPEAKRRKKGGD